MLRSLKPEGEDELWDVAMEFEAELVELLDAWPGRSAPTRSSLARTVVLLNRGAS